MKSPGDYLPRLSLIIVSYECRDLLIQCIESVRQDSVGVESEIIVVDNASADGSADLIRTTYPDVQLIANNTNEGFPAASNHGLAIARSSSLLLLNPDTVVVRGTLEVLLNFLEQEPRAKVVGLDVRNLDGSRQDSTRDSRPAATRFVFEQIGLLRVPVGDPPGRTVPPVGPQRVAAVSGAALAFTRPVVDRIGGLDEQMFWAEDLDFCIRAGAAGIPVFYLPGAKILHYGGESGKRNLRRMLYAQHASRITFADKHYGRSAGLALRLAFAALLPLKIAARLVQLSRPAQRSESRARIAGYWDALRFCFTGR